MLLALRVQGVATVERLAAALGSSQREAKERAGGLVARGLAEKSSGSLSGFALTEAGHSALGAAFDEEGAKADHVLSDLYRRSFVPLDEQMKAAATDWQVRRYGGAEIANDHSDPEYDHGVQNRLQEIHDRALAVLSEIEARLSRFAPYRVRLESCVERLRAGDMKAFTAAFAESYHTVWFELHADLLLTLGVERTE